MNRALRITRIAIFGVACVGLAVGSVGARSADAPPNTTAALKQALVQELAPEMVASVFADLQAIAQNGDRDGKLAQILNIHGLSPTVGQLASNLITEAADPMIVSSDRESLKEALVKQLPADQAASLFEQLSLAAKNGGSVDAVLDSSGLTGTQLDALAAVVNDWMASVGTR